VIADSGKEVKFVSTDAGLVISGYMKKQHTEHTEWEWIGSNDNVEDRVLLPSFSRMNQSAANRIGHHSMEPGGVACCRAAAGSKDEIQPAEILLE
jgi:hypothetical protein